LLLLRRGRGEGAVVHRIWSMGKEFFGWSLMVEVFRGQMVPMRKGRARGRREGGAGSRCEK
jgi:hypothetical protein